MVIIFAEMVAWRKNDMNIDIDEDDCIVVEMIRINRENHDIL